MAGFATVKRENVIVDIGANVDIPVGMKVATMEETITVSAESPVIDTKKTGTSTTFTQDELVQDPELARPLGAAAHRARRGHGPRQHGRQRERPAVELPRQGLRCGADAVWNLDGVNITDMAAIGASPTYFDYDAFQEIQITHQRQRHPPAHGRRRPELRDQARHQPVPRHAPRLLHPRGPRVDQHARRAGQTPPRASGRGRAAGHRRDRRTTTSRSPTTASTSAARS